ncbi:hypothetical protein Asppvi_005836 [Aspergillus pseudoviridinutans]|uniref:Uncharacterized protein n=1 Tax=Aspergillus pseudoviridinutans TaxID=1517512 RepID=A0A9P3B915_9EURO|nr:uncharacterized protein Asppvi_005836 [Aspergillus pseudoviridinutans]GIJ86937.1 hypothetical protein Asppvi_005836 [Aspergillus pseudoviridinutans]
MDFQYWSRDLGARAFLILQRLKQFYKTFALLNGFISVASATALSMEEFHPTSSSLASASEGLLCSSIITAIISAIMCIVLLLRFEGAENVTQGELAVAWAPLVLLDISVLEFLVGLLCWYLERNTSWRGLLMGVQFMVLTGFCVVLSFCIWSSLKMKGGLGKEERKTGSRNSMSHSPESSS